MPRKFGRIGRGSLAAAFLLVAVLALPAFARGDGDIGYTLVPDTAVLLTQNVSGGGGNGGNTSSTTSNTNIFSPGTYVDYKRSGGEPTTVVDRYPFQTGAMPSCAPVGAPSESLTTPPSVLDVSGLHNLCQSEAACPTGQTSCYHDLVYVSNPLGIGYPGFSEFYKSSDGGQTFRVPFHDPVFGTPGQTEESGGGDSHHAVGQTTHSVFLVDLSGACVTMNISRDLGETFSSNKLGCEANPGAIDDRQWVAADETGGLRNVYMTVNNDTGCLVTAQPGCSIVFVKSTDDGGANTPADFAGSDCTAATMAFSGGVGNLGASACPDPTDPNFLLAGPIVADTWSSSPHQHDLYIPFERNVNGSFQLWLAYSRDQGQTWQRQLVSDQGPHDTVNLFPDLTVDSGGNLYYTWSQTQRVDTSNAANEGETDAFYTYSTDGGDTWAPPIDLTKETGDSAVMPWMVAGDPGQVDLVYYKANSGLNPNIAYYDANGQSCDPSSQTGCQPNTTVWNTYFAQSQNALNTGANFKSVQISDHPIHIGGICTAGLACQNTQQQNRHLLDFLTVDLDHLGAANVTWAEDNDGRADTRQRFSRQLSGASVFKNQSISAQNTWPITDHAVTDVAGDTFDQNGLPTPCPAMDILSTSEKQNADNTITVSLTLGAPPTFTAAAACGHAGATGGLWGAEWWSASTPDATTGGVPNDYFYIAYRDNPADGPGHVEAGRMNNLNVTLASEEFHPTQVGTLGGNCFTVPAPTGPCTITLTTSLTTLGIKAGAGKYSITGLSAYYFGAANRPPGLRVPIGGSQQADAATPFDDNGTGTLTK